MGELACPSLGTLGAFEQKNSNSAHTIKAKTNRFRILYQLRCVVSMFFRSSNAVERKSIVQEMWNCYDVAIMRFAVHLLFGLGDKFMLLASRQGRMSHPARHVHYYLFDLIVKSVMDVLGRLMRVLLCKETAAV